MVVVVVVVVIIILSLCCTCMLNVTHFTENLWTRRRGEGYRAV